VPNCRKRITELLLPFLKDDMVILTHGFSRVVLQVLLAAAAQRKRIYVYATEGRPRCEGCVISNSLQMYRRLRQVDIPCTVVLDSAVAYIMPKVDMCLIGAEGVVESGGLFNAVGSFQLGIVAKATGKPVFAVAESYKFLRMFPLSQYDIPTQFRALPFPETDERVDQMEDDRLSAEMEALNPQVRVLLIRSTIPFQSLSRSSSATLVFSRHLACRMRCFLYTVVHS